MTFYSVILFVHVAGAERAAAALGEIAKRVGVRERLRPNRLLRNIHAIHIRNGRSPGLSYCRKLIKSPNLQEN